MNVINWRKCERPRFSPTALQLTEIVDEDGDVFTLYVDAYLDLAYQSIYYTRRETTEWFIGLTKD